MILLTPPRFTWLKMDLNNLSIIMGARKGNESFLTKTTKIQTKIRRKEVASIVANLDISRKIVTFTKRNKSPTTRTSLLL